MYFLKYFWSVFELPSYSSRVNNSQVYGTSPLMRISNLVLSKKHGALNLSTRYPVRCYRLLLNKIALSSDLLGTVPNSLPWKLS